MLQLRYYLHLISTIPFLPFLLKQGKHVRKTVPRLPEASQNLQSQAGIGKAERHIIFLGESTVAGVGIDDHHEGIAGSFSEYYASNESCTVSWEVVAKSGYTAQQVSERLVPKITKTHADLIVIGLGGNDSFARHSPNRWKKDISQLIQQIRTHHPDTSILFANLPPVGAFPAFPPLLQWMLGGVCELLRKALIPLIERYEGVYFYSDPIHFKNWQKEAPNLNGIEDFFSDGVHPSAVTYQIWGRRLAQFYNEAISDK